MSKRLRKIVRRVLERSCGLYVTRRPPLSVDALSAAQEVRRWAPGEAIFDVGANVGQTVLRLREAFPGAPIYAFEPVAATCAKLVEHTKHLPDVHCFNAGMGAQRGEATIYMHPRSATQHSLTPVAWEPVGTETIEILTVDQVMTDHRIDFIHLLKIDTEGHELEVLRGAADALANGRIAVIQLEVGVEPTVWPYTCLEPVRACLAEQGYFLHAFFEQTRVPVRPPAKWNASRQAGYQPRLLNRCEAVFIPATLEGAIPERRDLSAVQAQA